MMAYPNKCAENQKFVKLMDEMIAQRFEKHTLLSRKANIMFSSAIPVSTDSTKESSASLIILYDSNSEAPPSHHVVADPESNPSEAESEEDPSEDDPSEVVEPLSTQSIPLPDPYEATIAR
ncbi:hypothetical protein Tco_1563361 [Tanacetum coccineum]